MCPLQVEEQRAAASSRHLHIRHRTGLPRRSRRGLWCHIHPRSLRCESMEMDLRAPRIRHYGVWSRGSLFVSFLSDASMVSHRPGEGDRGAQAGHQQHGHPYWPVQMEASQGVVSGPAALRLRRLQLLVCICQQRRGEVGADHLLCCTKIATDWRCSSFGGFLVSSFGYSNSRALVLSMPGSAIAIVCMVSSGYASQVSSLCVKLTGE